MQMPMPKRNPSQETPLQNAVPIRYVEKMIKSQISILLKQFPRFRRNNHITGVGHHASNVWLV